MADTLKRSRLYATLIAAFPITLSVGILLIPVVDDYADHGPAEEAAAQSLRWALGHIHAAASFGLGILACCCIGDLLFRRGRRRRVVIALPLIAVGGALHAAGLGADGIGPIALAGSAEGMRAFFDGGGDLVTGVFIAGAVLFGLGMIALAFGVAEIGLVRGVWKFIVPTAAILFVTFEAWPSGWGLYGVAICAFLVFLPISLALRRRPARSNGAAGASGTLGAEGRGT